MNIHELTASHQAGARALAGAIRQAADGGAEAGVAAGFAQATVTAIATGAPPSVSVQVAGSATTVPGVPYLDGYHPVVGDIVYVALMGGKLWALGTMMDDSSTWLAHYTSDDPAQHGMFINASPVTYASYSITVPRPAIVTVHASVVCVGVAANAFGALQITDTYGNVRSVNNEGTSNGATAQTLVVEMRWYTDPGTNTPSIQRLVGTTGNAVNFWKFYSDVWVQRLG